MCACNGEEFAPKSSNEDGITVRDEAAGKTVEFAYHIEEESGNLIGGISGLQGAKVSPFGETIDHDKDSGVAMRRRKARDKVKSEIFPWRGGYQNWLE